MIVSGKSFKRELIKSQTIPLIPTILPQDFYCIPQWSRLCLRENIDSPQPLEHPPNFSIGLSVSNIAFQQRRDGSSCHHPKSVLFPIIWGATPDAVWREGSSFGCPSNVQKFWSLLRYRIPPAIHLQAILWDLWHSSSSPCTSFGGYFPIFEAFEKGRVFIGEWEIFSVEFVVSFVVFCYCLYIRCFLNHFLKWLLN